MCGIFGYTGNKPASPILLNGLRILEYRGYDSAGIYVPGSPVYKAVGPVDSLANLLPHALPGTAGIGHTRWATHGVPSVRNAHPHCNVRGNVWVVHNGIIENYVELRADIIEKQGEVFTSDTDTEVLAHLIGIEWDRTHSLPEAVMGALGKIEGTYGIAVMCEEVPDTIVTARMGSPIVLGIKENECFVASDTAPMLRHTQQVLYLEDGEYAVLTPRGYDVFSFAHERKQRNPEMLTIGFEEVQKGGHPHFMLKEICEIPNSLTESMRGRAILREGTVRLGGLDEHVDMLREITRVTIVGCGSAHYAGMIGKLLLEDIAGIPAETIIGSECRNRPLLSQDGLGMLAISQSGETADTLASLRVAKRMGVPTIGIVNVVGSSIARETDMGIYNHVGPELGVASTKAFVSQIEVLVLFAIYMGRLRGLSEARAAELLYELRALPEKVATLIARRDEVRNIAEEYLGYDDFLYIGRGYNYPTACEGALKLKEVSYVHAEGYSAGEMKHGPIAMIDELFPTIAIMPSDSLYEKNRSNVEEVRAREGRVLVIATEGNDSIHTIADDVLYIPHTRECLTPILASIPLQLFAYYTGTLRGVNVDRPRNLAKSVTVE